MLLKITEIVILLVLDLIFDPFRYIVEPEIVEMGYLDQLKLPIDVG